ncbi:MAG: hypothetical protein KGJ13_03495 [Patescibacteria group bacterium]|nr:hypothetical protein [Patescibacteria group bacterium]
MKITNQTNAGWIVINGSGWNHHKTADVLNGILADSADTLPIVPIGYAVLVAPISDKPFGLRCALVKAQARKVEVIDGVDYDDGPAEGAGEMDQWAFNVFGCEVERIHSVKEEQQSEDASQYFIKVISEQLLKLAIPA